ncbi:PLDc N-terminal domain-containing protein [Desulfacinum hydrothermale]|uniref:PLDc N-terminal domain-containing protein n=1 Tax=Desulfacinum hydrothermale TaxID=109258 RepID=UPI001483B0DA|nr:PLDc N-terminal domain-containing protein [Desulfacinum hydrothermale]
MKILVLAVLFVLPLVPTFWAIQEIPKRRFPSRRRKIVWFAVAATFPCVGALLYLLLERRHTVLAPEWGGPPSKAGPEGTREDRS